MFGFYGLHNHELMPLEKVFKQWVEKTSEVMGVKFEIDGKHESVGAEWTSQGLLDTK
tara:strand:- start:773 stop:943 length:171 start_codon:yes stop_codon:yes gene_type:complete